MVEAHPIGDKLRVKVLPQSERSEVLVTFSRETPLRRCVVEALGPDACQSVDFKVGQTVLANILAAQSFGDSLIIPAKAIVALME